jgi:hypothetical protein
VVELEPPGPSEYYRADPNYSRSADIATSTVARAYTNHAAWVNRHAAATVQVTHWLASSGLLGEPAREALAGYLGQDRLAKQAAADVAAAQVRLDQAKAALGEQVARARSGKAGLPAGRSAVDAEIELRASELIADEVKRSEPTTRQAWGRYIGAANWGQALAQAELLHGDEAERAVIWLRAKVAPPVGPDRDPLRWV